MAEAAIFGQGLPSVASPGICFLDMTRRTKWSGLFCSGLLAIVLVIVGCGSERISRPNVQGQWLLIRDDSGMVPEAKASLLRITATTVELRTREKGNVLLGGTRTYHWDADGRMVLDPSGNNPSKSVAILSAGNERMEITSLQETKREVYSRVDEDLWAQTVALAPAAEVHAAPAEEPAASQDGEFLAFLDERLEGIWEKAEGREPYPQLGLMVEMGHSKIRGQTFSTGMFKLQSHILGRAEQPCEYGMKNSKTAKIYCPYNKESYPMNIRFRSENELDIEFKEYKLRLHRTDERRFQYLAQKHKIQFRRLDEGSGIHQTASGSKSP